MNRKKDPLYKRIVHWAAVHGFLHCVPMLIYFLIYLVWFHLVEVIPRQHYMTIELPVDHQIPFCEIFVIPYLSWFALITFGMIYIYKKDVREFDRVSTVLVIGMTLFLLISTFLPNRQDLRLAAMPRDNVFTHMVSFIWHSDTPTNVWPSIHVYNAITVGSGLIRTEQHGKKRGWLEALYGIWAVLIILSTVFIKQHSLFDVITGAALAVVSYVYVYVRGNIFRLPKITKIVVVNEKTGKNMDLVDVPSSAPMTEAEYEVFMRERIEKRSGTVNAGRPEARGGAAKQGSGKNISLKKNSVRKRCRGKKEKAAG